MESLVIQFLASASVTKSGSCISGLSGNFATTIHLCSALMGRTSNLIPTTDLAMLRICLRRAWAPRGATIKLIRENVWLKCWPFGVSRNKGDADFVMFPFA